MVDFVFVEYRNAFYQGGFAKGRRQGKGILITDAGQIFVGNWKNDCLNDKALIFIDEKTHVIGEFNRGEMDGQFIYRSPKGTFYATFSNNRLTGRLVNIDRVQQQARLMQYKNLSYQTLENINVQGIKDGQVLEEMLGIKIDMPSLNDFIKKQMRQGDFYEVKTLNTGAEYVGFKKGLTVQRLGFTVSKDQLTSYGVYKQMVLNGLGYQFSNKTRYQGVFKNGLLNGTGIKYQMLQNKFLVGNFVDGNLKQLDDIDGDQLNGLPDLSDMKRRLHLRSIHFYNSFVQSNLLNFNGYSETLSKSSPQQEYIYPDTTSKSKLGMKSSQISSKNSKPNLLTKTSSRQEKRPLKEQSPISPTKSRKKVEDDPQLRGATSLLSKLQSKGHIGSTNANLRQYEQVEYQGRKQFQRYN